MSADCQLQVAGVGECGVLAIGRCVDCTRAFCDSHQALDVRGSDTVRMKNLCEECLRGRKRSEQQTQEAWLEVQRTKARELAAQVAASRRSIAQLAQALRDAGAPGIEQRRVVVGSAQTWLGFGKGRPRYEAIEPGWNVGTYEWRVHYPEFKDSMARSYDEKKVTWVTTTGDIVTEPSTSMYSGTAMDLSKSADVLLVEQRLRVIAERHGIQ